MSTLDGKKIKKVKKMRFGRQSKKTLTEPVVSSTDEHSLVSEPNCPPVVPLEEFINPPQSQPVDESDKSDSEHLTAELVDGTLNETTFEKPSFLKRAVNFLHDLFIKLKDIVAEGTLAIREFFSKGFYTREEPCPEEALPSPRKEPRTIASMFRARIELEKEKEKTLSNNL